MLNRSLLLLALQTLLFHRATAVNLAKLYPGLMDPDLQPKFVEPVTEALAENYTIVATRKVLKIGMYSTHKETGLIDPITGVRLTTPVFGYGTSVQTASWPGPTLLATNNLYSVIQWENKLSSIRSHPFTGLNGKPVLDTSLHWAYSLPGYTSYKVQVDGIPLVTHVHGSHAGPERDGNPDYFFSPDWKITGPGWQDIVYLYPNDQPAATLFYHDHTLGITRLNVYSGLVGFYIIRDRLDSGTRFNRLKLPSGNYEKAYTIQDRMFKNNGELFFPAYKNEPNYDDFIPGINASWNTDINGPTAFAEFFGDFMLVNGKIWPKQDVEPRRYRLRLLNACDSRFLIIKFFAVDGNSKTADGGTQLTYSIIGTHQGLSSKPVNGVSTSIIETGGRLDIVLDFSGHKGKRIVMTNEGGDSAFGGDIPGPQIYEHTGLIMAFDVSTKRVTDRSAVPSWTNLNSEVLSPVNKIRRVGVFEGRDPFGRLQPMLGGEKTMNVLETFTWSEPTTETPGYNQIEEWEIYNFSPDAVRCRLCTDSKAGVVLTHKWFVLRFAASDSLASRPFSGCRSLPPHL